MEQAPSIEAIVQAMTPQQQAELIGGTVETVRDPLTIPCPTCEQPAGIRCRRQGIGRAGMIYSGRYDGAVTAAHPKRRAATPSGERVVGPFVPVEP
jgi:hypothetical protein